MKISQSHNSQVNCLHLVSTDVASVTVMLLVGSGSIHEEASKAGTAHFLEHMMFKATKKRDTSLKIAMAMEKLGATSNAFTSNEYTGYYIKCPKTNYLEALEILADIVQNPIFAESELDKERQVIAEEIKMYDDQPEEKVRQLFNSALFQSSAYARDVAGDLDTIQRIEVQTLHDYREQNYHYDNCLLVMAGNYDQKRAEEEITKCFSILPGKGADPDLEENSFRNNQQLVTLVRPTQQLHLVLGCRAPKRGSTQEYALKLGNTMLSGGFGSILFQSLREKLGVSYYVHSNVTDYQSTGKFTIRMGIDQNRFAETMEQLQIELRDFRRGQFSDDDFDRAKSYLIGNYTTQLEATEDIAYWYGLHLLQRGSVLTYDELVQKISALTKEDIVSTWAELLDADNLLLAALGAKAHELQPIAISL